VRSAVLESEFNKVYYRIEAWCWWQILGALGGNPRVTAREPLQSPNTKLHCILLIYISLYPFAFLQIRPEFNLSFIYVSVAILQ